MSDLHPFKETGDALKAWLEAHPEQGTIKELSEKTGIHYSGLRHYFAGHSFPRGESLVKLRQVTGLAILNDEPTRRPPSARNAGAEAVRPAPAPGVPVMDGPKDDAEFNARNRSLLVALRSWRAVAGVSREDLALRLGCGLRTLDTWLNGEAYPRDPALLTAITRITGITFDADGTARLPSTPIPLTTAGPAPAVVLQAAASFAGLMANLQPVIKGPPAWRRALRDVINREDAGYLKAALEALYSDEEAFQTWKHFAHPEGSA